LRDFRDKVVILDNSGVFYEMVDEAGKELRNPLSVILSA
jgi:hypothetical protein